MSLFVILLGGSLVPTGRLRRQIAGARVIAADSGIHHAETLGLVPELWLGDFDSAPDPIPESLNAVPRRVFPEDKDMTDGELALAEARKRGATRVVLAGAFGGPRSDHAFLHLTTALAAAEQGLDVVLTSGTEEAVPLPAGRRSWDYDEGTLFSIVCFTELSGLTIEGARWPLKNRDIDFGSSLTLSNEVRGTLHTDLRRGRALLMAYTATV